MWDGSGYVKIGGGAVIRRRSGCMPFREIGGQVVRVKLARGECLRSGKAAIERGGEKRWGDSALLLIFKKGYCIYVSWAFGRLLVATYVAAIHEHRKLYVAVRCVLGLILGKQLCRCTSK